MEQIENIIQDSETERLQVVIVIVWNELYGVLADKAINAEQNINVSYSKSLKSAIGNEALLGLTLYSRTNWAVEVYSLPRLLWKARFIQELETMKETKQDHIKFYEKLVRICEHQVAVLRWQAQPDMELDINALQTDHTQCAFGKKLFNFLQKFDKHVHIVDFLQTFVEPHKRFHGRVVDIKEHFNDADKIETILDEIKNDIYPQLLRLFDNFNRELEKEINRNIYLFVRVWEQEQIVWLRVNKAAHIHEFEFEETEIYPWKKWYIALDKQNLLGLNKNWEPAIIQLLDIDLLLGNITS